MVHTSDKVQGQIYIPVANWIRGHSLPLPTTQLTLNFVSSYDNDHCYCRSL